MGEPLRYGTREFYLSEHERITQALHDLHQRLSGLYPDERTVKTDTFCSAQGSDRVRSETAQQASLHLTREILAAKSQIDMHTADLENVRLQLHYL